MLLGLIWPFAVMLNVTSLSVGTMIGIATVTTTVCDNPVGMVSDEGWKSLIAALTALAVILKVSAAPELLITNLKGTLCPGRNANLLLTSASAIVSSVISLALGWKSCGY